MHLRSKNTVICGQNFSKRFVLFIYLFFFPLLSFSYIASAALTTKLIANGLNKPVAITHANDHSNRLFITQQSGEILIHDGISILPTPFLNISAITLCCGEQGLLSVAFHPNYATNKLFFVNRTNLQGNTVVSRFQASASPNIANVNSRRTILTIVQPFDNHQGGQLQFGPDGYLYIGTGDGGSAGDPGNRAQNLKSLLGKMLRIDINKGLPYSIPSDNPFVPTSDARAEIWAYGLRNPWRFSFDRRTGQLFIADVGQKNWEEINLQPANSAGGENYGWRLMEGKHCFNPATNCVQDRILKRPIIEYPHTLGDCAVIGGYRYRGKAIMSFTGAYVFGDFCTGRIWRADFDIFNKKWVVNLLADTDYRISAFGEDEAGELYFADFLGGSIYKITGI